MSLAHRRVWIELVGSAYTVGTASLYCGDDASGRRTVKKWAREQAIKRGLTITGWLEEPRYDAKTGWEGAAFVARREAKSAP